MKSILFVCTGNICRSPMAEYLLRHMLAKAGIEDVEIFSRGIAAAPGTPMSPEALQALAAQGIDGRNHSAQLVAPEDLKRADLILVMEEGHARALGAAFAQNKIFLLKRYAGALPGDSLDIADPYGRSQEEYEKCRIEIQDALLSLLSKIKSLRRHSDGPHPVI